MNIDEALEKLAEYYHTASIAQRVLLRRVFRRFNRLDLILD
jgi:hypothetical protein